MGWFDEQVKQRKRKDDETFSEAFLGIAGAVMGKRLTAAMEDRTVADSAIGEVLHYFRIREREEDLPREVRTFEETLEYRLRPHGILRREVRLVSGWYRHAVGPMLGTKKEDGSAVALLPGRFSGYVMVDVKTGERVKLTRKTERLLDERATCFYRPLPLRKLSVGDLLLFMKDQLSLSDVLLYLGMMAAVALLGLLSPLFTKWLFGPVLETGDVGVLLSLGVFMVSYTVCRVLVSTYQSLVNSRVGIKQNVAVQAAVMGRIMSLPPAFFRQYGSGELTRRSAYVQSLCTTIFNTIGGVGLTSLFSLIYIGQIFAFAPSLVLPSLAVTLLSVLVSIVTTVMQMKISRAEMEIGTKESGMTYATITGIRKIRLAGAEKRMFARWAKLYAEDAKLLYDPPLFLKLGATVGLVLSLGGNFLLYYLAVKSGVGVADYYAFNAAYGMVSGAFFSLASIATTIATIRPIFDMAKPILEAEPELSDGNPIVTAIHGGIELCNVSFRYDKDSPLVLSDLSMKINPGEYVAIVGRTGCGKSTLIRLLLGFEKPEKGAIYYDKRDISSVDLRSLRRKIGVVTQNGKLFTGDIYSNIVISAPELTLDDAWEAAKIAAIDEDIEAMPMGMNTIISEGQGGISGGQRQRLMIARAVAPHPRVLIFDEATSALDNVTQKKVSDAIDSLKCTRVVIAHRLSTIRHANRILVLDGGRISEEGTYEELIAKNGLFAALVARQRIDPTDGNDDRKENQP